ncbi:MAG: hypothetical protein KI790_06495 [Cyclobacteriaceae bacterium]|nr:hypothetical protein [Cyclobacteriaceae bacterium HetDA_MAG_MS6]
MEYILWSNRVISLPVIFFFLLFVKKKNSFSKLLFTVILISGFSDIFSYAFIKYIYQNSYWISNTWYLLNFSLMTRLYGKILPEKKKILSYLNIIFYIGSLLSFLLFYSYLEANPFIRGWSSASFIFIGLLTYYKILELNPVDNILRYPIFWINTAFFFFFAVALPHSIFLNYLVFDLGLGPVMISSVTIFTLVSNILKNILLLYALILINQGQPTFLSRRPMNITSTLSSER